MLWDMHLCVFDVRLSFENRVNERDKIKMSVQQKQNHAVLNMFTNCSVV